MGREPAAREAIADGQDWSSHGQVGMGHTGETASVIIIQTLRAPGPLQRPLEGGGYAMGESPSEDTTPHGTPEEVALSRSYEAKLQAHLQPDLSFSFVNNILFLNFSEHQSRTMLPTGKMGC